MKFRHRERIRPSVGAAAVAFLAAGLLAAQSATQHLDPRVDQAQRQVKDLATEFAEILTPTPLESQLQARCAVNCTAVLDPQKGLTVAQELENIESRRRVTQARVGERIQGLANDYIVASVSTSDETLNRTALIENLSHILSGVTDHPPMVFVSGSGMRALLIFDNIGNGTMGDRSSYAALTAFNVNGPRLSLSDSTGGEMDGYGDIDVKELHSPVQGEIWLLVSGYLTGANGPNCRMRVYAYDGKKFRTTWAPANAWGVFATHVTREGFTVSGDYYRSNRHRLEHYQLAADGLYQVPTDR